MKATEKPLSQYPWYLRPIFRSQRRKYGAVLKSGLMWARVPRLLFAISLLYGFLDRKKSPLEPVLRSLIIVRVSQVNGCPFCIDLNSAKLVERTGSIDKITALSKWKESPLFNEKEKMALEYAEAMTFTDREVDDQLRSRLNGYFDEKAIVELTALIAYQNLSSKFNNALDVPSQGFREISLTAQN